jgi:sigma-E factor negative regulatory protein RseA
MAPAAAVAGFVAVGVTVVALRPDAAPGGFDERLAASPPADYGVMRRVGSSALPASGSGQMLVVDGQLIRDARLDAYFEAHRGAVGGGPSAVPGGALRSVEILVPQR